MDIKEFAPHMCPAASFDDPTAGEEFIEPGIAVNVNDAAKVLQMRPRVLPFTVGRVEEQSRRWSRADEWPLVTDIEPALAKAGVHSRPVLVLPVPGASTGTGVSST